MPKSRKAKLAEIDAIANRASWLLSRIKTIRGEIEIMLAGEYRRGRNDAEREGRVALKGALRDVRKRGFGEN